MTGLEALTKLKNGAVLQRDCWEKEGRIVCTVKDATGRNHMVNTFTGEDPYCQLRCHESIWYVRTASIVDASQFFNDDWEVVE